MARPGRITDLQKQVDRLLYAMERIQLDEYIRYLDNRKRLMSDAFLSGMLRGLGTAVGVTLLGAVVIVLLRYIVVENIPLIGGFLAEVVRVIQERL